MSISPSACALLRDGPPHDNGDAVALLGTHGVIDSELATQLQRAVGFRNVLEHEYVRVDDSVVLQRLRDPSDLDEFARQVAAWASGRA